MLFISDDGFLVFDLMSKKLIHEEHVTKKVHRLRDVSLSKDCRFLYDVKQPKFESGTLRMNDLKTKVVTTMELDFEAGVLTATPDGVRVVGGDGYSLHWSFIVPVERRTTRSLSAQCALSSKGGSFVLKEDNHGIDGDTLPVLSAVDHVFTSLAWTAHSDYFELPRDHPKHFLNVRPIEEDDEDEECSRRDEWVNEQQYEDDGSPCWDHEAVFLGNNDVLVSDTDGRFWLARSGSIVDGQVDAEVFPDLDSIRHNEINCDVKNTSDVTSLIQTSSPCHVATAHKSDGGVMIFALWDCRGLEVEESDATKQHTESQESRLDSKIGGSDSDSDSDSNSDSYSSYGSSDSKQSTRQQEPTSVERNPQNRQQFKMGKRKSVPAVVTRWSRRHQICGGGK